jgi:hypothetical protein
MGAQEGTFAGRAGGGSGALRILRHEGRRDDPLPSAGEAAALRKAEWRAHQARAPGTDAHGDSTLMGPRRGSLPTDRWGPKWLGGISRSAVAAAPCERALSHTSNA